MRLSDCDLDEFQFEIEVSVMELMQFKKKELRSVRTTSWNSGTQHNLNNHHRTAATDCRASLCNKANCVSTAK